MFNDCSNFYGTTSTSQSMFVCLTLNWCDSIFSCCCLFFFFSHSLYFLLASFSPDKKSATLVELAQQLQWYFLQWNSVTVCLQPHVKHEWNNRYSRFFLYSHTLCVSVFSILLAPFVHIVWLSINFLFLLTLVPFTFRRAFHSTFIIGFDHNLKWDTAVFVELCFCGKRERMREKIRLFKRPIYIYIENVRNNPQQSIVKTVWKWKCAKCHRSWLWGVPFIRNFVLQTTSLLSLLLPSSSRMVVLVVFFSNNIAVFHNVLRKIFIHANYPKEMLFPRSH